jgi:hypothetical protein
MSDGEFDEGVASMTQAVAESHPGQCQISPFIAPLSACDKVNLVT